MISVITLFTGIGAQEAALKRLGVNFKVVGISEIDKYAIRSYTAINGPTRQYGDITKVERLDYADLRTYSFPCQDLSVAGKQAGIKEGTRSGLLMEVERLLTTAVIEGNAPKFLLLENVKNLVGKKFKPDFDKWLETLDALGYRNYWQVLNAKEYGVPQNRERVFVVSIRKDVDTKGYKFPSPVPLEKRLKDMLEPCVDEKYYLSADKVEKLTSQVKEKEVNNAVRCGGRNCFDCKHTWDVVVEPLCAASRGRNPENPSDRTAGIPTEQTLEINYSGCSNTLTSVQKDNYVVEPQVLTPKRTDYGKQIRKDYESGLISESRHNMTSMKPRKDGISNTLTTVQKDNYIVEPQITEDYRIRKLTPKECWRLMGFTDEEFDAAQASGVSNSQLYKQAGNSIVVDVLVGIFKQLFERVK